MRSAVIASELSQRICFLTEQRWPPRFGTEIATDRIASELAPHTLVVCRGKAGASAYPVRVFDLDLFERILPRALRAAAMQHFAVRSVREPFDVWHAQSVAEIPWALELRRRFGGRTVVTLHALPIDNLPVTSWPRPRSRSESVRQEKARRARALLRECDAVIAVSAYMRDLVRDDVPSKRLFVVHNGVDHPDVIPPRPEKPAFLYLGRLVRGKGVEVLLEAWSRVRRELDGARLMIAGDGKLRSAVERAEGVEHFGYVEGEAKARLFKEASVVLLPSIVPEPWGLAAVEGMAHGRPVVGTGTGGMGEFLRDGETGWIVPPNDPLALASCLSTAARDPGSNDLAASAVRVAKTFTWARSAREILAVYGASSS